MKINMFVRFEDIEKYMRGSIIEAADNRSKAHIFDFDDDVVEVLVDCKEVLEKVKFRSKIYKGDFYKYLVQKEDQQ